MRLRKITRPALLCGIVLPLFAGTQAAQAQDTNEQKWGGDEIIVTANKTAQAIDDVPISISAYKQERMDQLGVRSIDDIAALTPGLQIENVRSRASGTNIAIRGISSRIGAGTTGIYLDDAPIQVRVIGYDASNVYPQVFDLERVEVLRGPQGTLYGAGSMGGNVRFITPKPNMTDLSIYGRGEISTTDGGAPSYEGGIAVGGPLIEDKIGVRLSAWYRRDGGWVDRADMNSGAITDRNANYQSTTALRGAVTFKPTETLSITPSVFFQKIDVNDAGVTWNTLSDPGAGIFKNGDPLYQPHRDRFILPNLDIEWDLGGAILTSSTSHFARRSYSEWDYSTVVPAILSAGALASLPGYTSTSYFIDKQANWSTELRLQSAESDSRLSWVVGLYASRRKQTNFQTIDAVGYNILATALGLPQIPAPPAVPNPVLFPDAGEYGLSTLLIANSAVDKQYAAFAEVNYKITDRLTATVGLRAERATLKFENAQSGIFNGPVSGGTANPKASPITPKFSVSYDIDDDNMVYATVAKGYRIGGGNSALPPTTCAAALADIGIAAAPSSYEPDHLWSYEIGSKNSFAGGRFQVASSAFYIDWNNIQQQVFPPCGFQYVENTGKLRSMGFDLQANARISRSFTLGATVAYVKAEYTEDAYPNDNSDLLPLVRDGNSPLGLRPWTLTLTADYDAPLSDQTSLYANGTLTYASADKNKTPFLDNTAVMDLGRINDAAQTLVNVRVGIRRDIVDVSLFAKNLLNSTARTARNHDHPNSLLYKEMSVRPRTVGLTATVRY
ncbi:MAG: TonB-dependent receptor [Sphingopyxis sp.]|nr:TonB-dependent receptor [Sphingopyxis sp.]